MQVILYVHEYVGKHNVHSIPDNLIFNNSIPDVDLDDDANFELQNAILKSILSFIIDIYLNFIGEKQCDQ